MSEQSNLQLKSLLLLVEGHANVNTSKESKNLESIRWYLRDLSERVFKNQMLNADEFETAARLAENMLSELIIVLNSEAA